MEKADGLIEGIEYEDLRTQLMWGYDGEVAPTNQRHELISFYTTAWLIRKGSVTIRFGPKSHTAVADQWIFPAMIWGWQEFVPGSEILSIRFQARWIDRRTLFDHSETRILQADDFPELEKTGKALVDVIHENVGNAQEYMLSKTISPPAHFRIQSLFQSWLAAYATTMQSLGLRPQFPQQRNERAMVALRFVEDHSLSRPLRDRDVARQAGISTSQLNRVFAQNFDTTPKRYFDHRRQEYASYSLIYGQTQIKTIAYKLGFSSLPHFTKWFKRLTGQSPSAYRKSFRREGRMREV